MCNTIGIIEQGKIDKLVLSNPRERRLVFDEAAGISKYRARKRETEARLGPSDSIGIATPGAISPATGLLRNANSTWLNGKPLLDDLARRFVDEGRHFHGAAGAVVQQPDGILVRLNHADPAAFLLKRNQFPTDHRDNGNIPAIHRLFGFQFLDGVNGRPVEDGRFFLACSRLGSGSGRASRRDLRFIRVGAVVQQHPGGRLVFQSVILSHPDGAAFAFVAADPRLGVHANGRQFIFRKRRHLAVGILALIRRPRHVIDEERPLPVREVRFLGKRIEHHTALLQDAFNHDPLVKRVT